MSDRQLNCEGLNCPMPIVEITRAVKAMESGQNLEVTATDLAFKLDLEAWSRRTGHKILEFQDGEILRAVIQIT